MHRSGKDAGCTARVAGVKGGRSVDRGGFTLVELMVVVGIIGLLAAIAIPNFLNFRLKAKTAEAKTNLGDLWTLESAYFAEHDRYVAGATEVPRAAAALDGGKVVWNTGSSFSIIGFGPENMVYFTYSLQPAGAVFPDRTTGFTALAVADLDDDDQLSTFYINYLKDDIFKEGAPY